MISKIRFSPEIEVFYSYKNYRRARRLRTFNIPGWEMGYDYSITADQDSCDSYGHDRDYPGAEYRPKKSNRLYFNDNSLDQIENLFNGIKKCGGHINKYCGLHIHIDATSLSVYKIRKIIKKFYKKQDAILKKYSPWYTRLEYCQPIKRDFLRLKNKHEFFGRYKRDESFNHIFTAKYFALNLGNLPIFGTIEFRFFNGTLNFNHFKAKLKWLLEFIDKA